MTALLVADSNRCQLDLCGTIPHSVDIKACHVAHLPCILFAAYLQPVSKVLALGLSTVELLAKLVDLRSHVAHGSSSPWHNWLRDSRAEGLSPIKHPRCCAAFVG